MKKFFTLFDETSIAFVLAGLCIIAACLFLPRVRISDNGKGRIYYQGDSEQQFWSKKMATKGYDVVVGGDSRVYEGVIASKVEEITGLRTYNFGFSSAAFTADYLRFLKEKLDKNARRPTLVLALSPLSLTKSSSKKNHYLDYKEKGYIESLLCTLFCLPGLESFAPLDIQHIATPVGVRWKVFYAGDGYASVQRDPPLAEFSVNKKFLENNKVSDELIVAFLAEVDLLIKEGVSIYAYRPPVSPMIEFEEIELISYPENHLRESLEKKGVVWLEFQSSDYDYSDGTHLEPESALLFSKHLADRLLQ